MIQPNENMDKGALEPASVLSACLRVSWGVKSDVTFKSLYLYL